MRPGSGAAPRRWPPSPSATWSEYAKVHKRPKGYAVDRWQLETYVLPRWGKRPIDEITKRDVRDLLQELADGKIAAKGKPTNVAPRSLRACLSKMFDWAADEGLLPGNPAAGVKLPAAGARAPQEGRPGPGALG